MSAAELEAMAAAAGQAHEEMLRCTAGVDAKLDVVVRPLVGRISVESNDRISPSDSEVIGECVNQVSGRLPEPSDQLLREFLAEGSSHCFEAGSQDRSISDFADDYNSSPDVARCVEIVEQELLTEVRPPSGQ